MRSRRNGIGMAMSGTIPSEGDGVLVAEKF